MLSVSDDSDRAAVPAAVRSFFCFLELVLIGTDFSLLARGVVAAGPLDRAEISALCKLCRLFVVDKRRVIEFAARTEDDIPARRHLGLQQDVISVEFVGNHKNTSDHKIQADLLNDVTHINSSPLAVFWVPADG